MKEHKTVSNTFTWIAADKRESRFGGMTPPRKPELRLPILWVARDGGELYLVNNSDESLEFVIADSGGFATEDDTVVTVAGNEPYAYHNVKPGDAVKIEEYDGFYDLDYVLQVHLKIKSPNLGCIEIASPPAKGGIGEMVLLWDSGEPGKNVQISRLE